MTSSQSPKRHHRLLPQDLLTPPQRSLPVIRVRVVVPNSRFRGRIRARGYRLAKLLLPSPRLYLAHDQRQPLPQNVSINFFSSITLSYDFNFPFSHHLINHILFSISFLTHFSSSFYYRTPSFHCSSTTRSPDKWGKEWSTSLRCLYPQTR